MSLCKQKILRTLGVRRGTSRTSLHSNPTTLLGTIKIMREPRLRRDFSNISTWASVNDLNKALRGRRYRTEYGPEPYIIPVSDEPQSDPVIEAIPVPDNFGCWKWGWKRSQPAALQPILLMLLGLVLVILWLLLAFANLKLSYRSRRSVSMAIAVATRAHLDLLEKVMCSLSLGLLVLTNSSAALRQLEPF